MNQNNAWNYKKDEAGVTTALVALTLMAILISLALFVNLGGALITRLRLQTMAELAAAGGGRVVAEKIARLQVEYLKNKLGREPTLEELKDDWPPQRHLTANQIANLQAPAMVDQVAEAARNYLMLNKFSAFPAINSVNELEVLSDEEPSADDKQTATIIYPAQINLCEPAKTKTIKVKVILRYNYPILFGKFAVNNSNFSNGIKIVVTGIYSLVICT